MPAFYELMFVLCLLLLMWMRIRLAGAHKMGRTEELPMLRWFVVGLSLTACSYLFRIYDLSRGAHFSLGGFLGGFAGTVALGMAYAEHVRIRIERAQRLPKTPPPLDPGLPSADGRFSLSAHQMLQIAQDEARRRDVTLVDTDHLLLGLLQQPQGAGLHILQRLGVSPVSVRTDLMAPIGNPDHTQTAKSEVQMILTDRAQQVVDLAAQEAHRFDSDCIGTEHLLLGLVLKGTGPAAHVLFGQGVTADRVRQAILQDRQVPH